ncbi:uncharacterized protein KD926_005626 [Aspergillus affinis]|uniref:uncharacterized protein n=1 Tax=Aspergillus affinis TaxID=1070780 RepID=UPI0022FE3B41|nr:uncharacterized protein KD926_005626 [Aspergillus affinis]KAI9042331.1 hypothetical protein KD926_005626 [Aspergillus affinis]
MTSGVLEGLTWTPDDAPLFQFNKFVLTHLDIAPRNLILDPHGKVWLTDWGEYPDGFEVASLRALIAGNQPNELNILQSRALPNASRRFAFGIDNAFTSADDVYVNDFISKATHVINLGYPDWKQLSVILHSAAQDRMENADEIRIKEMVQSLSLRAAVAVAWKEKFKVDIEDTDLVNLGEVINCVWIASKDIRTTRGFKDNHDLQKALSVVFPDHNLTDPRESPLNFILPAFETLWRIVLITFIEVGFKTGRHHPEWRKTLIAFAQNPTKLQFETANPISAEFLVKEALRLYPPTKRIYRAHKSAASHTHSIIAADIEACHIGPTIWGPGAKTYNPSRWAHLTKEQKNAFLPFGSAPFTCPAKSVFGPRIISLLVGVLFSQLQGDWRLDGVDDLARERLKNERNSYDGAVLVRSS